MGDNSDNIPGVKGIGPKTASKLINDFGNISSLLEKNQKEMKLDISWETLRPDFNDSMKRFSKKVKLPGFRPGKIPKDRLMQQIQPNIEAQFMDDNIQKYYFNALQE